MLGVSTPPASYKYSVNSQTGQTASATMTFKFQRGSVTNQLGLVKNNGHWQVSSITRK
jgi:hypothetical protein